ncbi:hypothetical protein P8452_02041 [Trifolium repens]|nr:hypothetical protein QL285_002194 [Trifolium repens]WJX11424.1 hypothetical protein P8452_02041 [Trifolium repens]
MLFDGVGKPFPVIYCDGETETNLGILKVDPTMNIKSLLFILSEKTKISPHQFSVFLADQDTDRKIPLTAKVNFAAVCHDGAAYYFYVKRSRRSKKFPAKNKNLSEKRMLLRRDGDVDGIKFSGVRQKFAVASSTVERAEMEKRVMNLRKEREAFLMSMGVKIESFRRETLKFNGGGGGGGSVNGGGGRSGGAVCRECLMARMKGTSVDFHLCCYDEVIVGFRTSAGPISRPVRNSGEDGH